MGTNFTLTFQGDGEALANLAVVLKAISDLILTNQQSEVDSATAKLAEQVQSLRTTNEQHS